MMASGRGKGIKDDFLQKLSLTEALKVGLDFDSQRHEEKHSRCRGNISKGKK